LAKQIVDGIRGILPSFVKPERRGFDWGGLVETAVKLAGTPIGQAVINRISAVPAPKRPGVVIQREQQPPAIDPYAVNASGIPLAAMPQPMPIPAGGVVPGGAPSAGMTGAPGAGIRGPIQAPMVQSAAVAAEPAPAPANGQIEIDKETATAVIYDHAKQKMLNIFEQNGGGDVAAGYLSIELPQLAGMLRLAKEPKQIETFIAGDAVLKAMVGDPRLPAFIEEFLEYFRQSDETEEE
jgi:hypothetical protein